MTRIAYRGPLSIEWEDSGMDRERGVNDSLAFVRSGDFTPSKLASNAAMHTTG